MKKTLLITGALLAFAAPVFAQGAANLAWNECILDGTAAQNRTSLCTQTAGNAGTMVASFNPPAAIPLYLGCNAVLDIQTNSGGGALSPWWRFDLPAASSCHGGKMSHNADFTLSTFACSDFFGGNASGGGNFTTPSPTVAPPSARVKEIWGVQESAAGLLNPGTEYYAFKISISYSMNPGFTLPNCPGCLDKACIVLQNIALGQPAPVPDTNIVGGVQNFITWQGGTGATICPQATPTHNTTWGSVKALYR
jgi:hypothetical protein